MNEINVNVSFEKRQLSLQGVSLVSGDYNSTKIKFEFDKEYEGRKVFELARPKEIDETGEAIFVKEIENNEIILVAQDEDGNEASIFKETGKYPFEISLYGADSKLTSMYGKLKVSKEMVKIGDEVVEVYLPIFDQLMNETNEAINNMNTLKQELEEKLNNGEFNGKDYILTEEDKEEIVDTVKPMVETDIQPVLENIENIAKQAEVIAKGRSSSVVTDTWAEMEEWLKNVANKGTHKTGDNLYIKAKYKDETMIERQPDYWITEVLEEPNKKGYYYEISELEGDKPDLEAYAKKEQFVTLTQEEYDKLETKNANTYYFIPEEE